MFKAITLTICLIAGTCQITFAQISQPYESKSTITAVKYSVYGTVIPIVVGGTCMLAASEDDITTFVIGLQVGSLGAVAGPGLGHAYAGRWEHFALGSLVRTVGAIFIASGIIELIGVYEEGKSSGAPALTFGCAIYLWSAIHDFRTLDRSVKRYNQRHTGTTISVNPIYYASKNAPGIVVSVSF
ncbi:MAG: hypothetical protein KAU01_00055 [Candidatus Cloacimonetes bacterium]|nr:hypothetical protein [Candidatus Cloacimonadota bacterium]